MIRDYVEPVRSQPLELLFTPREQAERGNQIAHAYTVSDLLRGETEFERLARVLKEEELKRKLSAYKKRVWEMGEVFGLDLPVVFSAMDHPPANLRPSSGPAFRP